MKIAPLIVSLVFLGDCAMAFAFHVVDEFIPEKRRMKNICWDLFPYFDTI